MSVLTVPIAQMSAPKRSRLRIHAPTDLVAMARRIYKDGLLNPLTVKKRGETFIVIDGVKRLKALKLLAKIGRLPRSLVKVPVTLQDAALANSVATHRPALLSGAAFVDAITEARKAGHDDFEIMQRFDCSPATLNMALSLSALHPHINDYFKSGHISLEQAAAFATLPNIDAQWRLLQELGPFAHAKEVIAAILQGQTVIEMPDGEIMIMPSRRSALSKRKIAPYKTESPQYKIAA